MEIGMKIPKYSVFYAIAFFKENEITCSPVRVYEYYGNKINTPDLLSEIGEKEQLDLLDYKSKVLIITSEKSYVQKMINMED